MKEVPLPLPDPIRTGIAEAVEQSGNKRQGISDAFRALEISYNIASMLAMAPSRHVRETLSYQIYKGLGASTPCEETFEDIKTAGKVDRIDTPDEQLKRIIENYPRFIKRMSVKFGRQFRPQMRFAESRDMARRHHRRQADKDIRIIRVTRELALMRFNDGQAYVIPEEGIPPEFYANSMKILPKEILIPA